MTGGAGFTKDMSNSSRTNRALLGNSGGTYGNFDSQAYGHPKSKTAPEFKEATPEVLASIRAEMHTQNLQSTKTRRLIIIGTSIVVMIGFILLFVKF